MDAPSINLRTDLVSRFGTTRDAAEICDVTPQTIGKWIAAGKIAGAKKRGGTWRINLDKIRRSRDSEDLIWMDGLDR